MPNPNELPSKILEAAHLSVEAAKARLLANNTLGDLINDLTTRQAELNKLKEPEKPLTPMEAAFLQSLLTEIDRLLTEKEKEVLVSQQRTPREQRQDILEGKSHSEVKNLLDLVKSVSKELKTITASELKVFIGRIEAEVSIIVEITEFSEVERLFVRDQLVNVGQKLISFKELWGRKLEEEKPNQSQEWMKSFFNSTNELRIKLDNRADYNPKKDRPILVSNIKLLDKIHENLIAKEEYVQVASVNKAIVMANELLNDVDIRIKELVTSEVKNLQQYIDLKNKVNTPVNNTVVALELRVTEINSLITDLETVSKDFDETKKEVVTELVKEAKTKLTELTISIDKIKEEEEKKPEVIFKNTQFFSSLIDFMNHATGGVSGSAIGVVGTNAKIADWPPEMQGARKTYQAERTKLESIKDSYDPNSKEFKWIENALKMGSQIYSHWDYSFSNMNGRTGGVDHQPGNASMDNQIVPKRARELMDFYNFIDVEDGGKRHKNGPYFEIKQIALYLLSGYKIKLDTRSPEDSNLEMTWLGDNAELFRGSVYYANYSEQSGEMWKTALFLYAYKKGIITEEEFNESFVTKGGSKRIKDGSFESNEKMIFRKLAVLQKDDLLNSDKHDSLRDRISAVSDQEIAEMKLFWEDVKTNMVFGGLPGEAYAYTALAGSSQAHEGFKLPGEVEGKRDFSLASRPLSAIAYLINNKPGTTDSMAMMLVAYSDKSIIEVMQRSGVILTQNDQESNDDFEIRKKNPMSYFRTPMRHMYEETKAWLNVVTDEHYLTEKMNAMHDCPMLDESILVNNNMIASRYFGVDASGFVYISEKFMEVFGDLDEAAVVHKIMDFHSKGNGRAKLLDKIPGNQIIGTYQGYFTRAILSYKDNNALFVNQINDIPLIDKIPFIGSFINEKKSKLQDQTKYEKLDNLRRHLANEMLSATTIKFMRGIKAVEELFQDADGVFSRNEYKESWEDVVVDFNDNQKKSAAQAMLRKRILEKIFNAQVEFVDGTKKDSKEIKIIKFNSIPKQFKRTKRFKQAEDYIHMVWEHLKKDSLIAKTRHSWSKFKGSFSENGFLDMVKPPIHIKDVVQKKD